ncbi:hypothetical protein [Chamaesiphon sp. OTE_75_metabat_556]|uniref:hypothetical protein n=1 Tax=Chamaesiphon sp. OTE_75_metabat_556 TaxID=2964692 RepID=UPI00286BB928|nr:hypothetical protein [Chamaesiphon sp. OTE_75_metabat_556]
MKLATAPKIHALGFQNSCQRALYGATQLFGGTNLSTAKTLIPAIAPNPRSVPPVVGVPAVMSPAVLPDPKFIGSVKIDEMPTYIKVEANLPYTPAEIAKGKALSVATIDQCSPASLDLGNWLGDFASDTPGSEDLTGLTTVEQFFYRESVAALAEITAANIAGLPANSIEKGLYQVNATVAAIPVVKILLHLPKQTGNTTYLGSVGLPSDGQGSSVG